MQCKFQLYNYIAIYVSENIHYYSDVSCGEMSSESGNLLLPCTHQQNVLAIII